MVSDDLGPADVGLVPDAVLGRRVRLGRETGAILVTDPDNVFWLTGAWGRRSERWLLFTGESWHAVPRRAVVDPARRVIEDAALLQNPVLSLCRRESVTLPLAVDRGPRWIASRACGTPDLLRDGRRLVSGVRQCKDADEIILMTRNAELVRQVLEAAAPAARAGVSERDIWAKIEAGLRAEPSRGLQLLGNCASGLRTVGGDPHASDRILQPGDPLLLDVYPRIDGYFADLTRTWFCGEPSPVLGRMVDAVTDALHRTAALLRPGVAGSDLDSEARAILEGHGYPRAYPHHTGHGLGVKQQERPWIRPRSADVIPEGAIVALEPACYVEGVGGVRLEDEYLVTAEGARPLGELAGAETRR